MNNAQSALKPKSEP